MMNKLNSKITKAGAEVASIEVDKEEEIEGREVEIKKVIQSRDLNKNDAMNKYTFSFYIFSIPVIHASIKKFLSLHFPYAFPLNHNLPLSI